MSFLFLIIVALPGFLLSCLWEAFLYTGEYVVTSYLWEMRIKNLELLFGQEAIAEAGMALWFPLHYVSTGSTYTHERPNVHAREKLPCG